MLRLAYPRTFRSVDGSRRGGGKSERSFLLRHIEIRYHYRGVRHCLMVVAVILLTKSSVFKPDLFNGLYPTTQMAITDDRLLNSSSKTQNPSRNRVLS